MESETLRPAYFLPSCFYFPETALFRPPDDFTSPIT